ncbi:pyridoxamine 5'-phosphate oxidase family protein [Embleya sp. NPDC059237]|uniref:pyridoxamine 5'-phosphate oxidase family protein n=1 Tax=Embleya sp. NPDC059237 TaxID=3346784 RepID=UPI0036BB2058
MTAAQPRLIEISGAEALWLLEGATTGRLLYGFAGITAIRPARHILEHGSLVVRAPVPLDVLVPPDETVPMVTYHADEIDPATARGWSVAATGPARPLPPGPERDHYRRVLPGWVHGPHDAIVRIRPHVTTAHRLGRPLTAVTDRG